MQGALLIVALVSGVATVVFIGRGLHRALAQHEPLDRRALVLTSILSLLTAIFTIWQLVLTAQQVHLAQ